MLRWGSRYFFNIHSKIMNTMFVCIRNITIFA
nr:MAG TPA: hypothetical protein [Bacteriophage sp.]DAV15575.1 MAG TPA: hypothetical protein [Caudoviricetes sp.]